MFEPLLTYITAAHEDKIAKDKSNTVNLVSPSPMGTTDDGDALTRVRYSHSRSRSLLVRAGCSCSLFVCAVRAGIDRRCPCHSSLLTP